MIDTIKVQIQIHPKSGVEMLVEIVIIVIIKIIQLNILKKERQQCLIMTIEDRFKILRFIRNQRKKMIIFKRIFKILKKCSNTSQENISNKKIKLLKHEVLYT